MVFDGVKRERERERAVGTDATMAEGWQYLCICGGASIGGQPVFCLPISFPIFWTRVKQDCDNKW